MFEKSGLRWVQPLRRWRRLGLKLLYVLLTGGRTNPLLERLERRNESHSSSSASLPDHLGPSEDGSNGAGNAAAMDDTGTSTDRPSSDDSDDSCEGPPCTHTMVKRTGSNATWVRVTCTSCGFVLENRRRQICEQTSNSQPKRHKM